MKILFLINGVGGGGKERRFLQLVGALKENPDMEILIVSVSSRSDYDLNFLFGKARVIDLGLQKRYTLFVALFRIIRDFRPHVIHSWCAIPIVLAVLAVGKIFFSYKYIAGFIADSNPLLSGSLLSTLVKMTYRVSDVIVSNSRSGLIAKGAPLKKSLVIYNGFDFSRLSRVNVDECLKLKSSLLQGKHFVVSMFARVDKAKDYDMFLSVARKIQFLRKDVLFLSIGKGNMLSYYLDKQKRERIENLRFVGFKSDVETFYFISDVCVLFTNDEYHAEGVSNSILEAMAFGKPIIATSGGGTPELVDDGIDGFLVPSKDVAMAVDRLQLLLSSAEKRAIMGKAAYDKIRNSFSIETMTKSYISIYKRLQEDVCCWKEC